jgi:hypothetical protein
MYNSIIRDLGTRRRLSGKLHASAALPLKKELRVSTLYDAGWARSERCGGKKSHLSLLKIETPFLV